MDQEFTHSEDEEEVVDVADEAAPFAEQESPVPPPGPDEPEDEDGDEEEKEHGTISSDLIRGHINTIILRSLYDGDKYGYAILEEIARKSHNQYQLKQPSLYSALKRLEKEGYITSYWGGTAGGGRRKYFSLTDQGKEVAERNLMEWEYSRAVIDSLISDKDFDFSSPAPSPVDMRVLRQSTSRVPTGGNDEAADESEVQEELAVSDTAEWDEPSQEPDETAEVPLSPLPADAIADSMPDLMTDSEELPADETAEPSSEETAPEESAEYPADTAPADTAPEETLPDETPEPSEQPVSPAYAAAEAGPATLSEPAPEGNETDEMTAAGEEAPAEATEATAPLPEDHPALLELQAKRAAFEEEQRRARVEDAARLLPFLFAEGDAGERRAAQPDEVGEGADDQGDGKDHAQARQGQPCGFLSSTIGPCSDLQRGVRHVSIDSFRCILGFRNMKLQQTGEDEFYFQESQRSRQKDEKQ